VFVIVEFALELHRIIYVYVCPGVGTRDERHHGISMKETNHLTVENL
jgi:hypothetical protein